MKKYIAFLVLIACVLIGNSNNALASEFLIQPTVGIRESEILASQSRSFYNVNQKVVYLANRYPVVWNEIFSGSVNYSVNTGEIYGKSYNFHIEEVELPGLLNIKASNIRTSIQSVSLGKITFKAVYDLTGFLPTPLEGVNAGNITLKSNCVATYTFHVPGTSIEY